MATTIHFDGADKPSHRKLLEGMGVKNFGFSFWGAWKRGFPKTKRYRLSEYFEDDAKIYVDSGWMQARRLNEEQLQGYVQEFEEFLSANADEISGVTELHLGDLSQWREDHDWLGDKLWPVWQPADGAPALFALAQTYANVALTREAVEDPVIQPRIGALHRQYGTSFHALNAMHPDTLRSVAVDTASTMSWASPQMRGETIVWDGSRLVRYQKKQKDQARSRYKAVVEKAGLDYQLILADDPTEVTRLAIWSYQQLETSMDKRPDLRIISGGLNDDISVTDRAKELVERNAEEDSSTVAQRDSETRNPMLPTVKKRDASERATLPVFRTEVKQTVEFVDGKEVIRDTPVLSTGSGSLRQCNTCVLSANCPAFRPDSECAFSLPVEIRTKEQYKALLTSIIEIQGQRVAFAKYAEDLNGGYPDPNLSQEIDRLFRLAKTMKDLESNNEFIRITAERQSSGGILSAIFGERAQSASLIEPPVKSDDIIHQLFDDD